jgi:hypothetical protein
MDQLSTVWLTEKLSFVRLGWNRALRILGLVHEAALRMRHGQIHRGDPNASCPVCQGTLKEESSRRALHTVKVAASKELERSVGKDRMQSHFYLQDNVWYTSTQLEKEGQVDCRDLDFSPFFDAWAIQKVVPVVSVKSPLFHALLMYIHFTDLPHKGTEATPARMRETLWPVGQARACITRMVQTCSKCRLILQRTVERELADLPDQRTTMAPPSLPSRLTSPWDSKLDCPMKARSVSPHMHW